MALVHAGNPASLSPGTEVGPWRVVSRRGGGTYGVVYLVEKTGHEDAGPFALKIARYPRDPRFEREGELLSRIHHPHVPQLHDRGWWVAPAGVAFPYIVMDWIEGVPLYAWASLHPRSWRQMMRVLAQVSRALAAAHAVEGVHRDVKGENVLVRKADGSAVLIDFGSANYRGASTLTRQPPPPGTPQYQSPESMRFEWEHLRQPTARYEAQPADDVYALGMMAYRLATGRYPPPVVDLEETEEGTRLIQLPLVPPEKWVELSPELSALIRQMLLAEPSARGSAAEVATALERAAETARPEEEHPRHPSPAPVSTTAPASSLTARKIRPVLQRRILIEAPWLVAIVGVVLAGGAWWTWRKSSRERLEEVAQEARDSDKEDVGTVGCGDTATVVSESVEKPMQARGGIGFEIPRKPLPGQRRPPCVKPMIEINGGCWVGPTDEPPPCGALSYEWNKRCYSPIMGLPQPTTSDPQ